MDNTDAKYEEIYLYFENLFDEIISGLDLVFDELSLSKEDRIIRKIQITHKINIYRKFIDEHHNEIIPNNKHRLGNYSYLFESSVMLSNFYGKPQFIKIKRDKMDNIAEMIPLFVEKYDLFLELKENMRYLLL